MYLMIYVTYFLSILYLMEHVHVHVTLAMDIILCNIYMFHELIHNVTWIMYLVPYTIRIWYFCQSYSINHFWCRAKWNLSVSTWKKTFIQKVGRSSVKDVPTAAVLRTFHQQKNWLMQLSWHGTVILSWEMSYMSLKWDLLMF